MSRELIMLAVTRYLTNEDLRFTVLSKEIIRVPFSGDNENVTFYCQEVSRGSNRNVIVAAFRS